MDFSNIFENITSSLKSIGNKVVDFVKNNKIISIAVGALILLLLLLLILIGNSTGKNKKSQKDVIQKPELILTENLIIPNGPEMENDYSLSRKTEDKWNDSEADDWFTAPTDKEIESLSTSNENMIKGIIEAAP